MTDTIVATLRESADMLERLLNDPGSIAKIASASDTLIRCFEAGGAVYSCGNGGSMSDAMHFAEELTGRYRQNRRGLAATAISDPGHLTCVANDFGYDAVFSRYLEARARPGDALLAISTSGRSANVIAAARFARQNGMGVISLTGATGSALGELADVDIAVGKSAFADRIQELHIKVIHILIEQVERHFFPDLYA